MINTFITSGREHESGFVYTSPGRVHAPNTGGFIHTQIVHQNEPVLSSRLQSPFYDELRKKYPTAFGNKASSPDVSGIKRRLVTPSKSEYIPSAVDMTGGPHTSQLQGKSGLPPRSNDIDMTIVGSPRRPRPSKARRASQQLQEILNRSMYSNCGSMYGSNTSLASESPSQADSTVSLKDRLRQNQQSLMELLSMKNLPFKQNSVERHQDRGERIAIKDDMSSKKLETENGAKLERNHVNSLSHFSAQLEALANAPIPRLKPRGNVGHISETTATKNSQKIAETSAPQERVPPLHHDRPLSPCSSIAPSEAGSETSGRRCHKLRTRRQSPLRGNHHISAPVSPVPTQSSLSDIYGGAKPKVRRSRDTMSESGRDHLPGHRVTFQDDRSSHRPASRQRYSSQPDLVDYTNRDSAAAAVRSARGRIDVDSDLDSDLDHMLRSPALVDRVTRRRNINTVRGRGARPRSVTPVRASSGYDSDMAVYNVTPSVNTTLNSTPVRHSSHTNDQILPNKDNNGASISQSDHVYSSSSESDVKGHHSYTASSVKSSPENKIYEKPPTGKSRMKSKGALNESQNPPTNGSSNMGNAELNTGHVMKKLVIKSEVDGYSEIEVTQSEGRTPSKATEEDPYETVDITGGLIVKNKPSDRMTDTDSGIMSHEGSLPQSGTEVKGRNRSPPKDRLDLQEELGEQGDAVYAQVNKPNRKQQGEPHVRPTGRVPQPDDEDDDDDDIHEQPPLPEKHLQTESNLTRSKELSSSRTSLSDKMGNLKKSAKNKFSKLKKAISLEKLNHPQDAGSPSAASQQKKMKKSSSLWSLTDKFSRKKKDKLEPGASLPPSAAKPPRHGVKNSRMSASASNLTTLDSRPIGRLQKVNADGTQVIELYRPPHGPFGFYIAKGGTKFNRGVFISRLSEGPSRNLFAGLLSVGDEILEIDGIPTEQLTLEDISTGIAESHELVLKTLPYMSRTDI